MTREKVTFTRERETLLATLYGRALDSRQDDPVLGDRMAEETVSRIDYDFSRIGVGPQEAVSVAIRARWLDTWTRAFLADQPEATVLHLGCGLDTRVYRIDPPAGVRWFDVDYPDVIALRRRLYPERPGYQMIGSSVTDLDWLADVPRDRPGMIVAEGLLIYLDDTGVRRLVQAVTSHLPSGQLAFDTVSRLGAKLQFLNPPVRRSGAKVGWGLDDPDELRQWVPALQVVTDLTMREMVTDADLARFSPHRQRQLRFASRFATFRKMGRLLRYRF